MGPTGGYLGRLPAPMPALPDDIAPLVSRLRDGDRGAFGTVFRALHGDLVRYGRRFADTEAETEDAVQEAFLTLWRRRETLDPGRSVRALLYTAVRNRLLNQRRDVARRADLHQTMDPRAAPDTPEETAHAALLGVRLREWLGELPDRQREAFGLSRFSGLSHAEIADVMGLAPKTVENHVGRALRHLRDRLQAVAPETLQP